MRAQAQKVLELFRRYKNLNEVAQETLEKDVNKALDELSNALAEDFVNSRDDSGPVSGVDYDRLVADAGSLHKYRPGTSTCVAFKHGAEWQARQQQKEDVGGDVVLAAANVQPKGTAAAATEERKLIGELRDVLDRIVSYYKNPRQTISLWDQAKSDHEHTMFGAAIAILDRTKAE